MKKHATHIFILLIATLILVHPLDAAAINEADISTLDAQTTAMPLKQHAVDAIQQLQAISPEDLQAAMQAPETIAWSAYPVSSAFMTPAPPANDGIFIAGLLQPLFLVGTDELSLAWLQKNNARLRAIHATGFLVQAQNSEEAKQVTAAAADLPLIPLSGDSFAKQLGINHYPLLLLPARSQ